MDQKKPPNQAAFNDYSIESEILFIGLGVLPERLFDRGIVGQCEGIPAELQRLNQCSSPLALLESMTLRIIQCRLHRIFGTLIQIDCGVCKKSAGLVSVIAVIVIDCSH